MTALPRKTNDVPHSMPLNGSWRWYDGSMAPLGKPNNLNLRLSFHTFDQTRGSSGTNSEFLPRTLSRGSCQVAFVWGLSCVQYLRGRSRAPRKATDTIVGRPTHLSATYSLTSQSGFFGPTTRRQISQRLLDAVFVRLNEFLAGIAIGLVTPPQPSFQKSSNVARCVTFEFHRVQINSQE